MLPETGHLLLARGTGQKKDHGNKEGREEGWDHIRSGLWGGLMMFLSLVSCKIPNNK